MNTFTWTGGGGGGAKTHAFAHAISSHKLVRLCGFICKKVGADPKESTTVFDFLLKI